eukprot:TRINITY_DN6248_c0_g1_i2.p1 TRINITY_DN6248_c0_g1~~TRINITY_DN6248_c0_g1_i2.p1  ORF type:complete len:378 (-),score=41.60 TRINITY_DN6248_c0_g1_i2:83-1120(-)
MKAHPPALLTLLLAWPVAGLGNLSNSLLRSATSGASNLSDDLDDFKKLNKYAHCNKKTDPYMVYKRNSGRAGENVMKAGQDAGLLQEETVAIFGWTLGDYEFVNRIAWGADEVEFGVEPFGYPTCKLSKAEVSPYIKVLVEGLHKLPPAQPATLWRGSKSLSFWRITLVNIRVQRMDSGAAQASSDVPGHGCGIGLRRRLRAKTNQAGGHREGGTAHASHPRGDHVVASNSGVGGKVHRSGKDCSTGYSEVLGQPCQGQDRGGGGEGDQDLQGKKTSQTNQDERNSMQILQIHVCSGSDLVSVPQTILGSFRGSGEIREGPSGLSRKGGSETPEQAEVIWANMRA